MPALIYDTTTQAFKDAETPKIYSSSDGAFIDAHGKIWDETAQAWKDAWGAINPYLDPSMWDDNGVTVTSTSTSIQWEGENAVTGVNKGVWACYKDTFASGSTITMTGHFRALGSWPRVYLIFCAQNTYTDTWIASVDLVTGGGQAGEEHDFSATITAPQNNLYFQIRCTTHSSVNLFRIDSMTVS